MLLLLLLLLLIVVLLPVNTTTEFRRSKIDVWVSRCSSLGGLVSQLVANLPCSAYIDSTNALDMVVCTRLIARALNKG